MKFDFVIGNPPYQDDRIGDNAGYAPPVYNDFMDAAYEVAEKVELIHPARFLFNAGSTPKAWNKKMLSDPHFKVMEYEEDATKYFSTAELKGGVAITYRDALKEFGAVNVFLKLKELNSILKKVTHNSSSFEGFDKIVISRTVYRLTERMHQDNPQARYKENDAGENIGQLSKGHDYDMATNIFERLPQIFFNEMPKDGNKYIRILGRENGNRVVKWVRKDYVNEPKPLFKYSIILPKANGSGKFGEILSQPIITEPGIGTTETFLSIGFFDTKIEDENCLKYLSTKFTRSMLGILKTTQDLTPDKWKYVPLQNFTPKSDIDWSKSVADIDQQLYKKYGLTQEEIDFIESNVKEME
ncbi:MAG: Eco57I restriction-modification methylase domain-containing protein [Clostridium sp.]|nr:Eco57I restriction-modification methylase domain-containing protein [Clostridium sp.]